MSKNNKNEELEVENEASSEENIKEVVKEVEVEVNVDYKDRFLRAQADYQNLMRETAKKRSEWAKMSEITVLEEFIPVYENFKKAFSHEVAEESKQWENWKKGIEFIKQQFKIILESHGLTEITVSPGDDFDPQRHEALSEEHSDEVDDGKIIREGHGGYMLGDKVFSAAKVVVCKKD